MLAIALCLGACHDLLGDDRPLLYVEGLATDVYFVGDPPAGAQTVNVAFATAPLDRMPLPSDFSISVVSFNRPGDNYFDDTLGLGELRDPVKGESRWLWAGPVPMGYPSGADFVGVKIRGLPYEAVASVPGDHNYCLVEAMGLGVRECAAWIDAILQLFVLCRGDLGQEVPCHGLSFEVVPAILLAGLGRFEPGGLMDNGQFEYVCISGLVIIHDTHGWRYARQGPARKMGEPSAALNYSRAFGDVDALADDIASTHGPVSGIDLLEMQPGWGALAASLRKRGAR